jgi:hypothetical protein
MALQESKLILMT